MRKTDCFGKTRLVRLELESIVIIITIIISILDGPSGDGHHVDGVVDNILAAPSDFPADRKVLPRN